MAPKKQKSKPKVSKSKSKEPKGSKSKVSKSKSKEPKGSKSKVSKSKSKEPKVSKSKSKSKEPKGSKSKPKVSKSKSKEPKGSKSKLKPEKQKAEKQPVVESPQCCIPALFYPVMLAIGILAIVVMALAYLNYQQVKADGIPYEGELEDLRKSIGDWLSTDALQNDSFKSIIQLTSLEQHIERELEVYDLRRLDYAQGFRTRMAPRSWLHYGRSNYYISKKKKNWFSAEKYCEVRNSHLASILSYEEQDFITSQISEPSWIGLSKDTAFGAWEWTDKSAFTTEYWSNEKSNSDHKEQAEQDCVTIGPTVNTFNWKKANCYKLNSWVCKTNQELDKS